jgi:hypothetical protein
MLTTPGRRAIAALMGATLILATGCGRITGSGGTPPADLPTASSPPSTPNLPDHGLQQNWDNPIFGVPVASAAAAQAQVPFTVYEPKGLGTPPTGVFATAADVAPEGRAVAFVFDTQEFGRVDVVEHVPDVPLDQYDAEHENLVATNGDPLLHGHFDLVTIRAGQKALVTTSEDGTRSAIFWLEGDAEIIVEGPALNFNQVVAIAQAL